MSDLKALRERVESATGADREIDAALWCALLHPDCKPSQSRPGYVAITDDDPSRWGYKEVEHYTASLDAALALVEAKLPGSAWSVSTVMFGRGGYVAGIGRVGLNEDIEARAPTPALALLAALLAALDGDTPNV